MHEKILLSLFALYHPINPIATFKYHRRSSYQYQNPFDSMNISIILCILFSRISPTRDTPDRDRLPHYGPRFSPQRYRISYANYLLIIIYLYVNLLFFIYLII